MGREPDTANPEYTSPMSAYDEVQYPSRAFYDTHPDRLAVMATLYGLDPAPARDCRILEIGCGAGGNLLPMALSLPDSELVGIEPSNDAVLAADTGASLGATNLRIERAGIEAIPDDVGSFDFVLCHGVFSWVSQPVREAILDVIRDRLTPRGVALISYNVYPGWHQQMAVRRMVNFDADPDHSPRERIARARELVAFLAEHSLEGDSTLEPFYRWLNDSWQGAVDGYLFHEYFANHNRPFWFSEFVALADRHDLMWLASVRPSVMAIEALPDKLAETLTNMDSLVEAQQYYDFASTRRFRSSLLVPTGVSLVREDVWRRIDRLAARTELKRDPGEGDLDDPTPILVADRYAGKSKVWGRPIRTALSILHHNEPEAIPVSALLDLVDGQVGLTPATRADLLRDLTALFFNDVVHLHAHQPRVTATVSEHPTASTWARFLAGRGPNITNQWHDQRRLSPEEVALIRQLDGETARSSLDADALESVRRQGYLCE